MTLISGEVHFGQTPVFFNESSCMQIEIRDAEPNDIQAVLQLMRDLADHEGLLAYFQLTGDSLAEYCLREPKRFHLLVAVSGAAVVGYATYMFQFSPWAGREYMFLDDLYVAEAARNAGAGRRLMQRVGEVAIGRGVDVRWHVETVNQSAQKFYSGLGAELRDKLIAYWTPEAIRAQLGSQ
jgi:GNAT superfamily N-acetyltransferase